MTMASFRIVSGRSGEGGSSCGSYGGRKSPDQDLEFCRTPFEDFVDDWLLLAGRAAGLVISFSIFFCWRRTSAVQ